MENGEVVPMVVVVVVPMVMGKWYQSRSGTDGRGGSGTNGSETNGEVVVTMVVR